MVQGGRASVRAAEAHVQESRFGIAAWHTGFVIVHAVPHGAAAASACAFEAQVAGLAAPKTKIRSRLRAVELGIAY